MQIPHGHPSAETMCDPSPKAKACAPDAEIGAGFMIQTAHTALANGLQAGAKTGALAVDGADRYQQWVPLPMNSCVMRGCAGPGSRWRSRVSSARLVTTRRGQLTLVDRGGI